MQQRCLTVGSAKAYVSARSFWKVHVDVPAVQISFGAILTPLGVFLLTYGFGSFFQLLPGADIAAILLIYGFPITLLGFALSYAQLKPVPCKTTKEALALRDAQATDIQKQVRQHIQKCIMVTIKLATDSVMMMSLP